MVITEKVSVRIVGQNFEHYKNLGYDCKFKYNIEVPPHHLTDMSKVKVLVECDVCYEQYLKEWKRYISSFKNGGYYACSKKCSADKIAATNLVKYGCVNQFENEEVKEKIKQTNLKNLGVEYPTQSKEVREKIIKVVQKKYGVDNVLLSPIIQQKIKDTWKLKTEDEIKELYKKYGDALTSKVKEKYNVDNVMYLDYFKLKATDTCFKNHGVRYFAQTEGYQQLLKDKKRIWLKQKYPNIDVLSDDGNLNLTLKCDKGEDHEFTIQSSTLWKRARTNVTLCNICNNIKINKRSERETDIFNYITSILPIDTIILHSQRISKDDRKQVDILIPSLNVAFEFNGLFWHSEKVRVNPTYHYNKTISTKNNDIDLYHIWEDEYVHKKDLLYSDIKNKLGIVDNKIQGKKTIVKNVSIDDAKSFLDNNHIKGSCDSTVRLGLYNNDELVSIIVFDYRVVNEQKSFEMLRYCNKINTVVTNSLSILFKHFIENSNITDLNEIILYNDIAKDNGIQYKGLGFEFIEHTELNYWYIIDDFRYSEQTFTKEILVEMGYSENKTREQILNEDFISSKIWGTGFDKYVFKLVTKQ